MKIELHTDQQGFLPYQRDEKTLSRPWAVPGTPGLEHRIGGLEKANITGNVSYDPDNHENMVRLRAEKIQRMQQDIPNLEVHGAPTGKVLVLGWGGTYGAIITAVERLQEQGESVSCAHLRYLNPFPANLGEVLKGFDKVIIPELNLGQLALLIRAQFLVDAVSYSKVKGKPFKVTEIVNKVKEYL
jgi:2-oxoglutarate ferredoxin oxidoreductase subunit alpha